MIEASRRSARRARSAYRATLPTLVSDERRRLVAADLARDRAEASVEAAHAGSSSASSDSHPTITTPVHLEDDAAVLAALATGARSSLARRDLTDSAPPGSDRAVGCAPAAGRVGRSAPGQRSARPRAAAGIEAVQRSTARSREESKTLCLGTHRACARAAAHRRASTRGRAPGTGATPRGSGHLARRAIFSRGSSMPQLPALVRDRDVQAQALALLPALRAATHTP
jgi:hypothetical protein